MGIYRFLGQQTSPGVYSLLANSSGDLIGQFEVDSLLNQLVVVESASVKSLLDSYLTRDVLPALDAMTGGTFTATSTPTSTVGVIRVRVDASMGFQEYAVTATVSSDVLVRGGSWLGCRHGLYAYLRELGFDQLGPGTAFLRTPTVETMPRRLSLSGSPTFDTISPPPQGPDSGASWPFANPTAQQTTWTAFHDANSCALLDYCSTGITPERQAFGGHARGAIYTAQQAALDASADHFAWIGGARQIGTTQFHVTHTGTVTGTDYSGTAGVPAIMTDYVEGDYDTIQAALGAHPELAGRRLNISVAYGDGEVVCTDTKCVDLVRNVAGGSTDALPVDLALWTASKVAAIAASRDIDAEIIEYAYEKFAAPPSAGYAVHPNVRVLLAPYTYALGTYDPRYLVEVFAARSALDGFKLGLYDYPGLPTFHESSPTFAAVLWWARVRHSRLHGIDTITGETSMAGGAVGLAWWGCHRLNWDPSLTDDELIEEYCERAFGAAAVPMERVIRRWHGNLWPRYVACEFTLGQDFDDLNDADALVTTDAGSRARVAQMMAYAIHLHYQFVWDQLIAGSPTEAAADTAGANLLRHAWRTHNNPIIDCKWLSDHVLAETDTSAAFVADWTVPTVAGDYAAWRTARGIVDYTDADIRTLFATVRALYPAPDAATHTEPDYSSLTVWGTPSGTTLQVGIYTTGLEGPETGHPVEFVVASGQTGSLLIEFSVTVGPGMTRLRLYQLVAGEEVSVSTTDVPMVFGATPSHSYALGSMTPGTYRLYIQNGTAAQHRLTPRSDLAITRAATTGRPAWNESIGFWEQYFHVPRGVTKFHFYAESSTGLAFWDESGGSVTPSLVGTYTYQLVVPSGQDNKAWKMEGNTGSSVRTTRFLDIPNRTAPSRAQLLVASNLASE